MKENARPRPSASGTAIALIVALAALAGGPAVAAMPDMVATAGPAQTPTTDRIIVKYRDGTQTTAPRLQAQALSAQRTAAVARIGDQYGLSMQAMHTTSNGARVFHLGKRMTEAQAAQVARDLAAQDSSVEYAEPDRMLHVFMTPNDPSFSSQWDLYEPTAGINAPAAWDKSTGSGIRVAVIDTGIRPHADVAANVLPGYDFISDLTVANDGNGRDSDASDPGDWAQAGECGGGTPAQNLNSTWHGTHVAGTIAALANNGRGIAGIAPNAKIVPARVIGKCGGYTSDISDAIVWASGGSVAGVPANANPARVINMSLGGGGACSTTMQNAINGARSRGTVVVVAAGNANAIAQDYNPANCDGVIVVAAINRAGNRAWYSNYGAIVDVAAPGGETSTTANGILSTLNSGLTTPANDSYGYYQGTSMAAPHVTGVVALMLARNPSLTPDQVKSLLRSSARPFPAPCYGCGAGILDASAAVTAAIGFSGGGSSGGGTGTTPPGNSESEPNDALSAAQPVTASGTVINGTMSSASDADYYVVQVPAGYRLNASMTPNASSDYELYIHDAGGAILARSENGTGVTDATSIVNASGGTVPYYVRVAYSSGGTGATAGRYSLTLSWSQVPVTSSNIDEVEPNDTAGSAQVIAASGTTVNGTMASETDSDYYAVQVPAGRTLTATLTPNGASDYDLYVYAPGSRLLGKSENGTGQADTVTSANGGSTTVTRYVRVLYYSGGTGASAGRYTLKFTW